MSDFMHTGTNMKKKKKLSVSDTTKNHFEYSLLFTVPYFELLPNLCTTTGTHGSVQIDRSMHFAVELHAKTYCYSGFFSILHFQFRNPLN